MQTWLSIRLSLYASLLIFHYMDSFLSVRPVDKSTKTTGCEVLFDVVYWTRPGVAVRDSHFVTQCLYFSKSFYTINLLIPRYHFLIWPTRLILPDIFMKYVITINVQAHDVQLIIQMILLVLFLLLYTFHFDV